MNSEARSNYPYREVSPVAASELVDFSGIPERLTVNQPDFDWSEQVKKKLNELCSLETGWDGYSAKPVSFTTAEFALSALEAIGKSNIPVPQIVPGYDGDLQIEWNLDAGEIELHVKAPYQVDAWMAKSGQPELEREVELRADFKIIADWLSQLNE